MPGTKPMFWQTTRHRIDLARPQVMAIVNLTPDSFSDGGQLASPDAAVERCEQLLRDGADILDIGGESTRPGAIAVPDDEEWRRVEPVLAGAMRLGCPVSLDSMKTEVMRRAIDLGVDIVNDVNALRADGAVGAGRRQWLGVCLMHMRGEPRSMQSLPPDYGDVVVEVREFLAERIAVLRRLGVDAERIVVDPGFGFGKTVAHNFTLLEQLDRLLVLGHPVLAGWSRKSSLGAVTGRAVDERLAASVAAALAAVLKGARIVRVHDVAATVDALKVWSAAGLPAGVCQPKFHADFTGSVTMSRKFFGTDGIRGTVGDSPITADFMLKLGHAVGRVLKRSSPAADRADRQGHTDLGLHDRVRARGRLCVGRRRRAADRPAADAGGRVSDACAEARPGRRHQRLAQSVRRQRHQVLFGAAAKSCPMPGSSRSRRRSREPPQWVDSLQLGKARRLDDAQGRYIEFCKSRFRATCR